jgi:hypothetical protein
MAVYVPPGRRRRATAALVAGALVLGGAIGYPIGRASAPSIGDRIGRARGEGRALVTALRVLPLEYRQAAGGSSETRLIESTVRRSTEGLPRALDAAPWLGPAQRGAVTAAVAAVRAAARGHVAPAAFDAVVARSARAVETVYGLPRSG